MATEKLLRKDMTKAGGNMYVVKVNGMKVKSYRFLDEAKAFARKHNGKVYGHKTEKLPRTVMVYYNDSAVAKREAYREVCSENNHGYHIMKRERKWE